MTLMELRRRVEAVVGGRVRARLPAELKRLVVAHARERRGRGASWASIAAEVGVSDKRLHAWVTAARSTSLARVVTPRMLPVHVTTRSVPVMPRSAIVVRGPRGVTVEGLSVSDVVELLAELSS